MINNFISNKKIIGLVLAGGLSSRMGKNKAFLSYNNQTLLEHMLETLGRLGLMDIFIEKTAI